MKYLCLIVAAAGVVGFLTLLYAVQVKPDQPLPQQQEQPRQLQGAEVRPSQLIQKEHQRLTDEFNRIIPKEGKIRQAADQLNALCKARCDLIERAAPVLDMMPAIATGRPTADTKVPVDVQELRRANAAVPQEDQQIRDALQRLRDAAREENNQEVLRLADQLGAHLQEEGHMLLPAAIVTAEYVGKIQNK